MTLEIRGVIHFLWMEGGSNREIAVRIHARYGNDSVSIRTIQNWTWRFASGDHTLEDAPPAGRHRSTEHVDEIRWPLEDDPFISQKKIEKTLDVHHATVKRILVKNLWPRKVNFKWIPHRRNEAQKAERVRL
jgi:transposase